MSGRYRSESVPARNPAGSGLSGNFRIRLSVDVVSIGCWPGRAVCCSPSRPGPARRRRQSLAIRGRTATAWRSVGCGARPPAKQQSAPASKRAALAPESGKRLQAPCALSSKGRLLLLRASSRSLKHDLWSNKSGYQANPYATRRGLRRYTRTFIPDVFWLPNTSKRSRGCDLREGTKSDRGRHLRAVSESRFRRLEKV